MAFTFEEGMALDDILNNPEFETLIAVEGKFYGHTFSATQVKFFSINALKHTLSVKEKWPIRPDRAWTIKNLNELVSTQLIRGFNQSQFSIAELVWAAKNPV